MIIQEAELLRHQSTALPQARQALLFAPHPDDEIFGCGGTLLLLAEQGTAVSIVIVTDGVAGGDAAGLVEQRAAESRAAAQLLGLAEPVFWGLPDRGLAYGEPLIQRIAEAIVVADADLLLLPSATELHPDHQVLAFAGVEAARRLGDKRRVLFYELSQPLPNPNLFIDISPVAGQKLAAMGCFRSQLNEQPYDRRIEGLNRFRSYHLGAAVSSAEAFLLVETAALVPGFTTLFEGPLTQRRQLGFAASGDDIPLVSIIIRSMDQPFLNEALDSVALQTYPHIEVLVVNAKGGVHRPLPEQCGPFPLRLLNQGGEALRRPVAANMGLQAVQGRFIGFLDDDDTVMPNHIHQLVSTLQATPHEAVAYSGVQGRKRNEPEAPVITTFAEPSVSFPKLLLGNVIPIHAVLFPAALHERGVRFDESLDCYEDWDFWLQILQLVPFEFAKQITATYYLGGGSGISPLDPDQALVIRALEKLYSKWGKWLTPELLIQIREIYQQRSNDFVRREEELNCRLHQRNLQLAESDSQLHQCNLQLAESDSQLHQCNLQLAESDSQLHQRNLQLAELDSRLHQRNLQLAELDSQLHQRNLQLAESDSQLHQRNLQLAELDSQLHQCNLQLAELDSRLHQRNLQLMALQQLLEQKEAELYAIKQTRFYRAYARMARLIPGGPN